MKRFEKIVGMVMVMFFSYGIVTGSFCEEGELKMEEGVLTLDKALELVLKNSYPLILANEDLQEAKRSLRDAKRMCWPRVYLQAAARGDLFNIDAWDSNNYSSYLTWEWDPWQNAQVLRRRSEAKINLTVAELSMSESEIDAIYETKKQYYDILKSKEKLGISEQALEVEEKKLAQIEKDYELGTRKRSEYLDALENYNKLVQNYDEEEQAYMLKIIGLQELTQFKPIQDVADVERVTDEKIDVSIEDCIKTAYNTRISLLITKQTLRSSELGVKYSKFRRWPQINFYSGTQFALAEQQFEQEFEFRAGVTVTYPLFDAGDTRSFIQSAKAAARKAKIQYKQAISNAEREIRMAYWAYENQLKTLKLAREREADFEDEYEKAKIDFERKAITEIQLKEAEISYLRSMQRIHSLELDVLLAKENLLNTIGVQSIGEIEKGDEEGKIAMGG